METLFGKILLEDSESEQPYSIFQNKDGGYFIVDFLHPIYLETKLKIPWRA